MIDQVACVVGKFVEAQLDKIRAGFGGQGNVSFGLLIGTDENGDAELGHAGEEIDVARVYGRLAKKGFRDTGLRPVRVA